MMNVTFNNLLAMDFEQRDSKPVLQGITSRHISPGLDLTYAPSIIISQKLTERKLDLLFESIYDDYIGGQLSDALRIAHAAPRIQNLQAPNASAITTDSTLTLTNSFTQATTILITSLDVDKLQQQSQHVLQQDNQPQLQSKIVVENLFKNKLDEENTVIRNKTRLVRRGHHQEEEIDFKESFTLVARIEAIKILLAYTSHKSFIVFQMDVKIAFLHGSLKEDVYVCQPKDFINVDHPVHVYKLKKAHYGLKQAPRDDMTNYQSLSYRITSSKGTIDLTLFIRRFSDDILVNLILKRKVSELVIEKLMDYGFHFNKIPIYCDSKSAIGISFNLVQHLRTKHIDVHYHFIMEHVEKGTTELYFVKTDYQLADIFTKYLPVERLKYLVCYLGMGNLSPQELKCLAKS
uniref:Retrovirus-related Pol polyprotein from transposon TNT 1-94 n=1 Tax=Tanacetum cinerariifolium TaxID=118510 RepID=A0A699GQ06_TANCI|nr:retrovirus-related Pol polyprotein from transposon TNT 1-94 [Tanacetum cinerariifolium]